MHRKGEPEDEANIHKRRIGSLVVLKWEKCHTVLRFLIDHLKTCSMITAHQMLGFIFSTIHQVLCMVLLITCRGEPMSITGGSGGHVYPTEVLIIPTLWNVFTIQSVCCSVRKK